ncbi:sigma factor [Flavivirga sp. 57AJ16]|nr:sigma factor [Flavivirga sp. 57AJ16]
MEGDKKELTLMDYKQLFESLYPQLCVFAHGYLNDMETAKELVQEVFVMVWENRVTFPNENHRTGYFYSAVKKECFNYLKTNVFLN